MAGVAATACFLITERALSRNGRYWSCCPKPDLGPAKVGEIGEWLHADRGAVLAG
jgi:hypothetical protein